MIKKNIESIIRKIIILEREEKYDLSIIKNLSLDIIDYIRIQKIELNNEIYKFLDDFDLRYKDDKYRIFQTEKIERLINSEDNPLR